MQILKHIRKQKKWSQTKLSQESGVSQTYISELEAGKSDPSVSIVKKLSKALGVNVHELLGDEEREQLAQ